MELKFLLFPAQAYLAVLLVEGLSRFIRVTLMDPLMLQEQARFSTVLRQFSFLALIVILDFARQGTLLWIVWAELAASTLGMIAAGTLLWRQLYELHGRIGQSGWSAPALSAQWHIAGRMYVTHLLTLVYSPQVIIILIQRTMGVESSALFGFLSNLQRQIANYLPATLLFSLIRTKMVADYVGGGGMAELSRNANLAGKLSLFALMPLVTLTALAGDPTVAWLSGNKFTDSGLLLFGLMLALVPYSQWQLNQSVAVVVGHADLCILAAASGLVVFPLMWIMLQLGLGLWSAIIAIGLGYMILNIILVTGVSRWADYRADWMGFFKLLFSALVACSISMLLHMEDLEVWISTWLLVVLQSLLAILIYFVLAWWIKPFAAEERNRINALAKRRVFFW